MTPSPPPADERRTTIANGLRVLIGLSLITLLGWRASTHEALGEFADGPIRWLLVVAAFGLLVVSISLSFVRWRLIAGAAGLAMSLGEAFRLGAAGFAANFVALGNIGGDVVRAALLAKRQKGRRALAVTTVLVDRLMGLFALLLFASAGVLLSGVLASDTPLAVRLVSQTTLGCTAIAIASFVIAVMPGRPVWRLAFALRRTPWVGRLLGQAALLLDAYRQGRPQIFAALLVGVVTDAAFVGSFLALAKALPLDTPSAAAHYFIVPLGMIAGAVPISPSGLGTVEAAIDALYQAILGPDAIGNGSLAAFGHRLLMLSVGAVAVIYYLSSGERREAEQAIIDSSAATSVDGSGTTDGSPAA